LHLNESSGALADSSGNNNNGTVSGSVTYGATGKFKTALSWSGGSNRYVFVNNPTLNLANTGGSVAVWIQPTLALGANTGMGVIRKPDYGGNLNTPGGYGMEIYRATAGGAHNIKMHLGWNNGSTNSQQILVGAIPLTSGNWYQAVITWNTTTMSIYVNGVLDVSATRTLGPLNWASNSATLDIGRNSDSVSTNRAWYSGVIDEVAVFNRTLTPTEVLDFYKRGAFELRHQVRSCNDSGCNGETFVGPSGTAADYYDDANNTGLTTPSFSLTNLTTNRYFQYKSYFDTDTALYGPELRSITINNNGSGSISTETTEPTAAACLDLSSQLVSTFIPAIPFDPASGTVSKTYYAIKKTGSDNLVIRACSPELNQAVEVRQ
jgi:hypothetical protein